MLFAFFVLSRFPPLTISRCGVCQGRPCSPPAFPSRSTQPLFVLNKLPLSLSSPLKSLSRPASPGWTHPFLSFAFAFSFFKHRPLLPLALSPLPLPGDSVLSWSFQTATAPTKPLPTHLRRHLIPSHLQIITPPCPESFCEISLGHIVSCNTHP